MPKLLWFHAFARDEVADVLDVLRLGPRHHPDPESDTRKHEGQLGIAPPRVYAYVGRTLEQFGANAIALAEHNAEGELSPFDSGGLVNKIQPVAQYCDAVKQDYLRAFTWRLGEKSIRLAEYPAASVGEYLDGSKPPTPDGPFRVWYSPYVAPIWMANNDWRAWTWEVRVSAGFNIGALERWTCSPSLYPLLLQHLRQDIRNAANIPWATNLMTRYVSGGVSTLVRLLRQEQAV